MNSKICRNAVHTNKMKVKFFWKTETPQKCSVKLLNKKRKKCKISQMFSFTGNPSSERKCFCYKILEIETKRFEKEKKNQLSLRWHFLTKDKKVYFCWNTYSPSQKMFLYVVLWIDQIHSHGLFFYIHTIYILYQFLYIIISFYMWFVKMIK